ncbi:MliC family protein [Moraxella sp. Tifton1]|uniref:MliC family protein n=1 Tax=Moraxella oculi TaxID=2940516 RepID=UPI002011D09A|nr:MliC family protein [Moraxella sp. Tifton1]MCL1623156.1 MliC family protein [Moraxella sp. Tifton1]
MKKTPLIITAVVSAALLGGCAAGTNKSMSQHDNMTAMTHHKGVHHGHHQHNATMKLTSSNNAREFSCDNGLVVSTSYLSDEKIMLKTREFQGILTIAPSGSGSRYVSNQGLFGYGGEWHEKGNIGILSAKNVHGQPIQTTCQAGR